MKKMKKIASIILAMVMALVMTVPAFAQTVGEAMADTGSITIKNASRGAEYTVYKIFSATYESTNNPSVPSTIVAYKYDGTVETWNSVEKLNDYFELDPDSERMTVTAKAAAFKSNQIPTNPSDFAAAELSEGATKVLDELATKTTPIYRNQTAIDGGALIFQGLPYGYYLVKSNLNEGADGSTKIAIDSATPNAEMYDKNVIEPTWDPNNGKKIISINEVGITNAPVNETTADFGDKITFQLRVKTQNYAEDQGEYKKITEYKIHDSFNANAFEFNEIKDVKVVHQEINENKETVETSTPVENWSPKPVTADNGQFTITVPWVNTADNNNSLYEANDVLVITYTATLKDGADIAGTGNINTATLGWNYTTGNGPDPEDEKNTRTDEATVYTYALAIDKVDAKNPAKKLQGAQFEVYKGDSSSTTRPQITVTDLGNGVYKYDPEGAAIIKSPANGLIIIKGISKGTYSIKETVAPKGYNKLDKEKKVEASEVGSSTTIIKYTLENGKVTHTEITTTEVGADETAWNVARVEVQNKQGSLLPSTGGIGTTIFYIIGGILVVGAAVLLVTKKRMSKEV